MAEAWCLLFFEESELRSDSGDGLRVVRIGIHALKRGSRKSLWNRLAQHRGIIKRGGGNHRGSIFRLLAGTALAASSSPKSMRYNGNMEMLKTAMAR